jgi:hypothetical protein
MAMSDAEPLEHLQQHRADDGLIVHDHCAKI